MTKPMQKTEGAKRTLTNCERSKVQTILLIIQEDSLADVCPITTSLL